MHVGFSTCSCALTKSIGETQSMSLVHYPTVYRAAIPHVSVSFVPCKRVIAANNRERKLHQMLKVPSLIMTMVVGLYAVK
jgi:hypothetical protein